jgi:hypothetical protein
MNVFFIILIGAIVKPIVGLLNLELLIKYFLRGKALSEGIFNREKTVKTQRELNEMFENHDINFGIKFSHICNLVLLSLFFLPIFPAGPLLSIFGLFLTYLVEKFNILRKYRRPNMGEGSLVKFLLYEFKIFIFIYSVSAYLTFLDG